MNRTIIIGLALPFLFAVSTVNAQGGPLGEINNKVDVLDGKIDVLDGKVDTVDGKVDTVDGKIDVLDGKLDDLESLVTSKPAIRFVKLANFVLAGGNSQFQIRLLCDSSFGVKSFLVTARDVSQNVDINFFRARLLSNPFGGDITPPTGWSVGHADFPIVAGASSAGHELLSNMGVPLLGIPDGASFDIFGSRSPNTGVTTLTIGATVETDANTENSCKIVVVDF